MKFVVNKLLLFTALFSIVVCSVEPYDDSEEEEEFIPTDEWQLIKPGQSIPAGLHVKFDMTNGGRWAKLLNKEKADADENSGGIVKVDSAVANVPPVVEVENTAATASYDIDEIKMKLKKMKNDQKEVKEEEGDPVDSRFRSMDQIREELSDMYLTQETDYEVMEKQVALLISADDNDESKVLALQELEYYVHQVDNANDFFAIENAFGTLMQCMNSSSSVVRENAIHVIGSAVQSNPSAQVKAIKENVVPSLLRLLSDPSETLKVKKKSIFALSCLLRNFPRAQIEMWKLGGYHSLMDVITKHESSSVLQVKVIRLFTDLVTERQNIDKLHVDYKERLRQYNIVPLNTILKTLQFCNDIAFLLDSSESQYEEVVTVLNALTSMKHICKNSLSLDSLQVRLDTLAVSYSEKSNEEKASGEDDGYFDHLLSLVRQVQQSYKLFKPSVKNEGNRHDIERESIDENTMQMQSNFERHKTEL